MMSNQALSHTDAILGDNRHWAWRSQLRVGTEFLLLFTLAIFVAEALSETSRSYLHPLWLPVIVLSLQRGTPAGITAAVVATGLFLWEGLPPAVLSEDLYQYIGRVGVEPIAWTCAALLIGYVRDRQIRERSEFQAELAERDQHCRAVAEQCDNLRRRAELLERHIAANAMSSPSDIAEAVCSLHESDSTNFADRISRFILLLTGGTEFTIYLLLHNQLRIAVDVGNERSESVDIVVPANDPLFEAVVNSRRTLLATREPDRGFLDHRGLVIGPLLDRSSSHEVIGMLRIGGDDLVDFAQDIERKFALVCSEISLLLGRSILINSPDVTPASTVRLIEHLKIRPSLEGRRRPPKTDARELETA
jgi:hypothetical protein